MRHYNLDHFQIPKHREAPNWMAFLALALLVSCVWVWAAIIQGLPQ